MRRFNEKIPLRIANALVTRRTEIGVVTLEISHAEYCDVMWFFFLMGFSKRCVERSFSLLALSRC